MLADEEAEAIRKGLAEGWRGPILLRWFEHFLKDRDERRQKERETPLTHDGPALGEQPARGWPLSVASQARRGLLV